MDIMIGSFNMYKRINSRALFKLIGDAKFEV
jgi:hypothetical protein